jgi:hypothetical protein
LEPIQEASADDTLAESSEQAETDKAMEDIVEAILIEQPDPQSVNISDAPIGQPQRPFKQADHQPAKVQSPLAVHLTLSFFDSLFLPPGYCS